MISVCSARTRTPCAIAVAVFGASLIVYTLTASRSLCWGDSAEFVAVASTLGVAHPPGYPLYTLLGAVAVRLPFGTPFLRMSMLSAVFAAGAAAVAALTVWVATGPAPAGKGRGAAPRAAGALFAGGALAFGPTYWSQAVVPEVYSLSAFLALSALLMFTVWNRTRGAEEPEPSAGSLPRFLLRDRPVVLMGLVLGLALAHHLTAVFLALPIAVALLGARRRPTLGAAFSALGLLALGLSLYVYLPLRAAHDPAVLWTPIGTWRELLEHIAGVQYAPLLFGAPLVEVSHKMRVFASGLPGEVGWLGLLLAVPGLVALVKRRGTRWVALAIMCWGLLVLGHAAVYRIPDIDSYYIPVYVTLAIAGGLGLCAVASAPWWRRAARPVGWLALVVALAIPVAQARSGWSANDWRTRRDGVLYLERMLDSIAPGGVVVTMTDRVLFPLWCARYVDRTREDFSIACIREHAPHLERWCAGVRFPTEEELCSSFGGWSTSVAEPARGAIPIGNYLPLLVSMNQEERRFYADADLGRRVFADRSVPRGLLVEIVSAPVDSLPDEQRSEQDAFWRDVLSELRDEPSTDRRTTKVYATTLAEQGMLAVERGDVDDAIRTLELACAAARDVPLCHNNLGVAYDRAGRRAEGIAEFEAAIMLDPGLATPHHNMAVAYRDSGDTDRAKSELEVAIVLAPGNPTFRMELGGLLEELSEFEAAEEMFRGASGLSEDEWGASLAYGDFLRRRKRYSEAVAAYQRAEELRPGSAGALRGLGRCYWALEDRERALEVTQRLVELQPHNPTVKYDLALMLHRSGRGREAVYLLDDVIRILPRMWEARAFKASIMAELGRYWEARALFEEAADLGAFGAAYWERWAEMEAAMGDGGHEQAVRARAAQSESARNGSEPPAIAE